jgi:glycosyltransferase involved in cell wall biosynthesis
MSYAPRRPELSIIIPTYRRPEKLHRALSSVIESMSYAHEVIVIDDCPDGSAFEVALKFKVRYVNKGGAQRGQSASRNIGISMARGKYLCFLDDDDFLIPEGVTRLLDEGSGYGQILFGDYQAFNFESRIDVVLSGVSLDVLLVANQIPMGAFLIEKSSILRNFDERMRSHEDWDFLLSHAVTGGLHYVPGVVVAIDKTENSTISTEARRRKYFWLDFLSVYASFPASHLEEKRRQMLTSLGIGLPAGLLNFDDQI